MKKLIFNEKNGNFKVVSKRYVLYGRIGGYNAYVHFENADRTYILHSFPTRHIINLLREKISWKQFACLVEHDYAQQEAEFQERMKVDE